MVDGGGGPSFPVAFYDGEKEMKIGNVNINPTLDYKTFQLMLSQRIGISPNQISIYLVDRKKNPKSSSPVYGDDRRRIPITGKVNFGIISRQKDCYFLVVLKRSRKSRNRKERMMLNGGVEFSDYSSPEIHPVPDNIILLRRNQPTPFVDEVNYRLQSLRIHRENYQAAMATPNPFPSLQDSYKDPAKNLIMTKNSVYYCEECEKSKFDENGTNSFHHCVNDPVLLGWSRSSRPISRPERNLG